MIPEFICMTTSWGGRDLSLLQEKIPNLILSVDTEHDAMKNFLASMRLTNKPAVHIEDDIVLCNDFYEKVISAVNKYPNNVINFFSIRKEDYEIGAPHLVKGRRYLMNQCFYLPAYYGMAIADYYEIWDRKEEHPTGLDVLIADFLKTKKVDYIQWFPHLVNHQETKSLINPKRSSKRTDKFFIK